MSSCLIRPASTETGCGVTGSFPLSATPEWLPRAARAEIVIVLGSATAGLPASMGSPRLCARQARTSRATSTVAGSRTPEPPAPYRPPPARHDNKKTAVLQTGVLHPSRHLTHLINSSLRLLLPTTTATTNPPKTRGGAMTTAHLLLRRS